MSEFVTLRVSGMAKKRREERTETTVNVELRELEVRYRQNVFDAKRLHRLAVKRSAAEIAEALFPEEYDNYFIPNDEKRQWDVQIEANAVEIAEFAEEYVEQSNEDTSVVDVLTLWLRTFGSMRIRRALHDHLRNEYDVPANHID